MRVLIATYSETGNTARIAEAIYDEVVGQGHEVDSRKVGEITAEALNDYDLVFLGSACHDADLAKPVKQILEQVPIPPAFKLAGFVTHASYGPEGGDREQQLHATWAARCAVSFRQASRVMRFDLLGYFGCQGAPSPPIAQFIHHSIVTDEEEWAEYIEEATKHPDEEDLRKAREFARDVLARF
jgi:flavodoxin